jgi:hypothetical protein
MILEQCIINRTKESKRDVTLICRRSHEILRDVCTTEHKNSITFLGIQIDDQFNFRVVSTKETRNLHINLQRWSEGGGDITSSAVSNTNLESRTATI